ncbi:CAP domain-containing protein, partial [Myxococcota bacterium]|nr:CAP domain-containing protein [Myxococcota bacterium]
AALADAAQAHADRACALAIAAHVLPGDPSTPADRARRAGYDGRVAENVAIAPSVTRAHANLLATPSHRKNVLDPAAKSLGVGVATTSPAPGREPAFCVVELYGFE